MPIDRRFGGRKKKITPDKLKTARTHLVFLGNERVSPATLADLITETRQSYSGPLVVGEDLMSFEIGETVQIRRGHPASAGHS